MILCIAVLCIVYTYADAGDNKVVLHEYRQNVSVTSCSRGLLHGVDKMVYNTTIDLSLFNKGLKLIAYEIIKWNGHGFQTVCFMKIPRDCRGFEDGDCYCESTAYKNVYNMILNTTANRAYNKLRVQTSYEDYSSTFTDEIEIPKTADPDDIKTMLIINNQTVDTNNCTLTVDGFTVDVTFKCTEEHLSPCVLEAIDVLKNATLLQGTGAINYSTQYTRATEIRILLRKRICSSSKIDTVYCNINVGHDKEKNLNNVIYVISILLALVCLFSIIGILYIVYRKKKLKKTNEELARKSMNEKADEGLL